VPRTADLTRDDSFLRAECSSFTSPFGRWRMRPARTVCSPAGEDGSAAEVELQRNCVQMMGCEMLLEDEACRENIVVSLTSDVRKAHVDVEMSKPSGPLAQSMF
jgi:hypothetical protein